MASQIRQVQWNFAPLSFYYDDRILVAAYATHVRARVFGRVSDQDHGAANFKKPSFLSCPMKLESLSQFRHFWIHEVCAHAELTRVCTPPHARTNTGTITRALART